MAGEVPIGTPPAAAAGMVSAEEVVARLARLEAREERLQGIREERVPPLKLRRPDDYAGVRGTEVDQWLFEVSRYLDYNRVANEADRVLYASTLLKRDAAKWWRTEYSYATFEGTVPILVRDGVNLLTWIGFCTGLRKQYKPTNASMVARNQLAALRSWKGGGTVREYTAKFRSLVLEIEDMSPAEAFNAYLRGLDNRIKEEAILREVGTLEALITFAERWDEVKAALWTKGGNSGERGEHSRRGAHKPQAAHNQGQGPVPMEIGTLKQQAGKPSQPKLKRDVECHGCHQLGHIRRFCPLRKKPQGEAENNPAR